MRVAHMIAKEESWFSSMLMASSIRSVMGAVEKLVLVDNGCSDTCIQICSSVFDEFKLAGKKLVFVDAVGEKDFSKLRNLCIFESKPGDLILKLDADDVHYAEGVSKVFDFMDLDKRVALVFGQFYHHRRDPYQYQCLHKKDIFFRQYADTRWEKPVHESMEGLHGERVERDYKYHHFGYCKSRSELLAHWINYDVLELGEVKRYDMSSVEAVDPKKNLHGQFDPKENQKYEGEFPPQVGWMFDGSMQKRGMTWDETGLVGSEFDPLAEMINAKHNDKV